ncbi:hypothetical protein AYO41_02070 [Verrucomicrobia bacterium SCGC AG-212-E04]|nr:hypothetical protein AYO41_02070 [Verrucomicrobia bacterium SCGC AG-212-E04]
MQRAGCGWYADALARAIAEVMSAEDELLLYHHFGDWINVRTDEGTVIEAPRVHMPLLQLTAREAARVWANPSDPLLGRPEIVHATSFRAPRVPGARLVFTVHDVAFWTVPEYTTDENRLACQTGMLQALDTADGLIFISQSTRDEFERILPGWADHRGLPTAVIHSAARKIGSPGGPSGALPAGLGGDASSSLYWLAVGTIEPRKNYDALVRALQRYRERSARPVPIVFAGSDGWKSASLHEEFARLEREGSVRWLGYVSEPDLIALYQHARGLLFPGWYEGFGLPVLEAMGNGCPVISSDRTSLREVGGDAALYIDPAVPETIADAMLALEREADLTAIREAGHRQARKFTWEKTASETRQFYDVVLASRLR